MKKNMRGIIGIMMSASMVMSPVMQAMASNQYDVQMEDVAGSVLFPGDSVSGVEPVYLGPDGVQQELSDGTWTNHTDQAYEMSGMDGEEGGLWLQPVGYVLTVNGGTSRLTDTDGTDTSNHYRAKYEESEEKKDVAYYDAWSDVTIQAADPEEGKVFDHWQIDSANVSLTDAAANTTNFAMAEAEVILTAVYADAPAESPEQQEVQTETLTDELDGEEGYSDEEGTGEEGYSDEEGTGEEGYSGGEGTGEEGYSGGEGTGEEGYPDEEGTGEEGTGEEGYSDGGVADGGENDIITIGDNESDFSDNNAAQESTPVTYTLTVENGSGSGEYEVGTEVTISAAELEGMVFTGWTTDAVSVWFQDSSSPETVFPMPAEAVTVTANYEAVLPELYSVQVENGEGSGSYEAGSQVAVMAYDAPEGMEFAGWSVSENVVLDDAGSMEAYFTMPAQDVILTANYKASEETPDTREDENAEEAEEVITEASADPDFSDFEDTDETDGEEYTETEPVSEVFVETEPEETEGELPAEEETETEAEEDNEAEETVTYRLDLSDENDITVAGASAEDRNDGYGVRLYAAPGTTITITAAEYDSRIFQGWNVTKADGSQEAVEVEDDPDDYLSATFEMPEAAVYIEAVYEELSDNEVQVINGSGSGIYTEGDVVEISADEPEEGYRFKNWIVITGDVALDDPSSEITEFVMPAEAVQVKAVYEVIKYTLTVENGSGSGSYTVGETVNLTANYPSSGKVFAGWSVTSGNASVAAADRYYSSITMPAENVTLKATYKDGPSPDYNEIQNIVSGGEYLRGSTITFTAVGNGMSNTNPNPGDYRYRPIGYQIGSVNGSWNNSPYTTSMAINAVGQYTLTVNFTKDVFDGNSWTSDGSVVSKSVTFHVVNALSVQTGDSSPIIPLIIAAVVALAVIIILIIAKKRRR